MNNLLLFMSISGTCAFTGYFIIKIFFKKNLTPGYSYLLLKLVLMFFLFPFPFFRNKIVYTIGRLTGNSAMLNGYSLGKTYRYLAGEKIYHVTDGKIIFPHYNFIFWFCILVWSIFVGSYFLYFIYNKRKLRKIKQLAIGECYSVLTYLDVEYETILQKYNVRILFLPSKIPAFTYGFFSPVIVIQTDLDKNTISCILKHELMHIKEKDIWINFFSYLAVAIHFFNPFIYLFYKEIRKIAELNCDEKILKNAEKNERLQYGHMIIEQAYHTFDKRFTIGFSGQKNQELKERLLMIKTRPVKKWYVAMISIVIISVMGTIPVMGYVTPEAIGSEICEQDTIEYMEIGEIDIDFPEDEKMFRNMSYYFLTEDNKIIIETSSNEPRRWPCNYAYMPATQKVHIKFQSGGCRVDIYSVKRCDKCGAIRDKVKTNSISYEKCIHG